MVDLLTCNVVEFIIFVIYQCPDIIHLKEWCVNTPEYPHTCDRFKCQLTGDVIFLRIAQITVLGKYHYNKFIPFKNCQSAFFCARLRPWRDDLHHFMLHWCCDRCNGPIRARLCATHQIVSTLTSCYNVPFALAFTLATRPTSASQSERVLYHHTRQLHVL